MKKTIVYFLCAIFTVSAFAISDEDKAKQEKENMKMLAEMGLPLPGSGIKIIPRAMMNLSEDTLHKGQQEQEEIKEKGYVELYIAKARELLNFEKEIKRDAFPAEKMTDQSTLPRKNPKDIKLAFDYETLAEANSLVAGENDIHAIAAVPQGGFHDDTGGWSGIAEFFTAKNIGTCDYGLMNVKASNTAAELAMEDVTYIINNKATLMRIEGSENSGFLYTINWYDENNFHELECANMKFSEDIKNKVIELAKKIDN